MKRKLLFLILLLVPMLVMAQKDEKVQQTKKLAITAEAGAMFGLQKGGGAALSVTVGVGSWLDNHFYLGGHTGAIIGLQEGSSVTIPLFARMEYKFNGNKAAGLSLPFDVGYVFRANSIMVGVLPTYTFSLNSWSNLKFGVGYIGSISTKGYGMGHNLGARIGWQFYPGRTTPRVNSTRDSGLQYSLEFGMASDGRRYSEGKNYGAHGSGGTFEPAVGFALTYKYNPAISFGVTVNGGGPQLTNFALRGQYRLTDKKGSLFGAADLGMAVMSDLRVHSSVFIAPAVGYSLRAAGNSYFDIKLGYKIGPSIKLDDEVAPTSVRNRGVFLTLSWTHTTKLFQRK